MYCLKASFINSHSSVEKYLDNSWVKSLVFYGYPTVRQACGGAHLVLMAIPKT